MRPWRHLPLRRPAPGAGGGRPGPERCDTGPVTAPSPTPPDRGGRGPPGPARRAGVRAEPPPSGGDAGEVEADYAGQDQADRYQLEGGHRVAEEGHADHGGARGADAGPY